MVTLTIALIPNLVVKAHNCMYFAMTIGGSTIRILMFRLLSLTLWFGYKEL